MELLTGNIDQLHFSMKNVLKQILFKISSTISSKTYKIMTNE